MLLRQHGKELQSSDLPTFTSQHGGVAMRQPVTPQEICDLAAHVGAPSMPRPSLFMSGFVSRSGSHPLQMTMFSVDLCWMACRTDNLASKAAPEAIRRDCVCRSLPAKQRQRLMEALRTRQCEYRIIGTLQFQKILSRYITATCRGTTAILY